MPLHPVGQHWKTVWNISQNLAAWKRKSWGMHTPPPADHWLGIAPGRMPPPVEHWLRIAWGGHALVGTSGCWAGRHAGTAGSVWQTDSHLPSKRKALAKGASWLGRTEVVRRWRKCGRALTTPTPGGLPVSPEMRVQRFWTSFFKSYLIYSEINVLYTLLEGSTRGMRVKAEWPQFCILWEITTSTQKLVTVFLWVGILVPASVPGPSPQAYLRYTPASRYWVTSCQ